MRIQSKGAFRGRWRSLVGVTAPGVVLAGFWLDGCSGGDKFVASADGVAGESQGGTASGVGGAPDETGGSESSLAGAASGGANGGVAGGETNGGETNGGQAGGGEGPGTSVCSPACSTNETCVDGSCEPLPCNGDCCDPGSKRCDGEQPQVCNSNGAWVDSGAACAGAEVCDALGSGECTEAPTVVGGSFNRLNDAARPATVSAFRLARTEATVAKFRAFVTAVLSQSWHPASGAGKHTHLNGGKGLKVGDAAYESGWNTSWNSVALPATAKAWSDQQLNCPGNLSTWKDAAGDWESKPMNCIRWEQAYAFCIWEGGFLPSSTELNYAAAGGAEQRVYPWGAEQPGANAALAAYGCFYLGAGTCSPNSIAPVGSIAAGVGRWGQLDLAGNVQEWTFDSKVGSGSCTDCAALDTGTGLFRGGAFSTNAATLLTTSHTIIQTDLVNPSVGVRCAFAP